jgi:hypothetical protein
MTSSGPPKWLVEIRQYWSEMTVRLADESGQPAVTAPEIGFSVLPERPAPVREQQRPEREALPARSDGAD